MLDKSFLVLSLVFFTIDLGGLKSISHIGFAKTLSWIFAEWQTMHSIMRWSIGKRTIAFVRQWRIVIFVESLIPWRSRYIPGQKVGIRVGLKHPTVPSMDREAILIWRREWIAFMLTGGGGIALRRLWWTMSLLDGRVIVFFKGAIFIFDVVDFFFPRMWLFWTSVHPIPLEVPSLSLHRHFHLPPHSSPHHPRSSSRTSLLDSV